ncbi:energy transducer TonB [Tichowtungia aerotolerans]|uniref:TonB C-terminal domain-containing protein n=1 Tax=Tichowtungia aerotolerans TaxID=2697043 RepID=A0A6P1M8T0_9BACT|nr:energy transducer TonB [Tichowtungia aerotolerans]QHI68518.1 hypothetical protein GT409_03295 [Tichowtungia aerotolerans]
MNKSCPFERLTRLAALCLCGAVYLIVLVLVFQGLENQRNAAVPVASAVKLSFVQAELQAEPAPLPEPAPKPEPKPEPEEADVALEDVPEEPMPEPTPEPPREEPPRPEAPVAQVSQEAAAPVYSVAPDQVQGWVIEQIEREKYYPPAAERFGLQGTFDLLVILDEHGTILSAEVLGGEGHRILRQALEKMLVKLPGRSFGQPIGETLAFEVEFSFEPF